MRGLSRWWPQQSDSSGESCLPRYVWLAALVSSSGRVLLLPNNPSPQTDASESTLGAAMSKKFDEREHPIIYISHKLIHA